MDHGSLIFGDADDLPGCERLFVDGSVYRADVDMWSNKEMVID